MHQVQASWHALSVARPIPSTVIFLGVMATCLAGGMSLGQAAFSASPALPICVAGFLINNIFDQEADRINHPDRPLARFPALTRSVTLIYVASFISAIALISIQGSGDERAFWAIMLLLLSNYAFIKRNIPLLKNIYMAIVGCFGLGAVDLALDQSFSGTIPYAVFGLAMFARELALDICDTEGDESSLAKKMGVSRTKWVASSTYLLAFSLMLFSSENAAEMFSAVAALGGLSVYVTAYAVFGLEESRTRILTGVLVALPVLNVAN